MEEKISGIYKIECLVNGKVYIGQSVNIIRRFQTHKSQLRNNTHINNYLQRAWNKYGEENFMFEIIEECNKNISEREIYWIDFYDSLKNGYNLTAGGFGGHLGVPKTDKWIKAMSKLKGIPLKEETKRRLSQSRTGIKISEEQKENISRTLKYLYENGLKSKDNYWARGKNNIKSIAVYQFDINTLEIINRFDCILEAERYIGVAGVSDCLKNRQKSAGGFYWQKVEDTIDGKYIGKIKTNEPNRRVMVYQIDVNSGNIINTFDSIADANAFIGKPRKSGDISATCSGRQKTSGGYIWRYSNKEI